MEKINLTTALAAKPLKLYFRNPNYEFKLYDGKMSLIVKGWALLYRTGTLKVPIRTVSFTDWIFEGGILVLVFDELIDNELNYVEDYLANYTITDYYLMSLLRDPIKRGNDFSFKPEEYAEILDRYPSVEVEKSWLNYLKFVEQQIVEAIGDDWRNFAFMSMSVRKTEEGYKLFFEDKLLEELTPIEMIMVMFQLKNFIDFLRGLVKYPEKLEYEVPEQFKSKKQPPFNLQLNILEETKDLLYSILEESEVFIADRGGNLIKPDKKKNQKPN